jgi:hypothetical protein
VSSTFVLDSVVVLGSDFTSAGDDSGSSVFSASFISGFALVEKDSFDCCFVGAPFLPKNFL